MVFIANFDEVVCYIIFCRRQFEIETYKVNYFFKSILLQNHCYFTYTIVQSCVMCGILITNETLRKLYHVKCKYIYKKKSTFKY